MTKSWNVLNETQLQKLSRVIAEMEHKTSGEIRLMIVHRSAVAGHVVPLLWCLIMVFLLLTFDLDQVLWTLKGIEFKNSVWLWLVLLLVSFGLARFLGRFDSVKRWMTSREDLNQQVLARAEVEFHREGVARTKEQTGILLLLSLMEHQAVVLADEGISARVPANTWDKVIELVVQGAKSDALSDKLEEALRLCGSLLAQHFPASANNTNELVNTVVVKE